jgi:hypothetical protein
VLKAFWAIVDDVKRKPYDLLDFSRTQFDRDYLEFNVNIHDMEISLQAFINSSFENISSTQHALSLLAQFKAILLRESLREELESKVQVRTWREWAPNMCCCCACVLYVWEYMCVLAHAEVTTVATRTTIVVFFPLLWPIRKNSRGM